MRRLLLPCALAVLAAACTSGGATTTTTVAPTTTMAPTTTTEAPGALEFQPGGEVFIAEGSRGPLVEAMQFYLVCSGLETVGPDGPTVTVDGAFGPITADAVALYQAERRIIPTGEPDEATFADMARSCDRDRPVEFEEGAASTEVAGHASSDDPDTLTVNAAEKQLLTLVLLEGDVMFTVTGADGTSVDSSTDPWEVELPTAQSYVIEISAASPTPYRLSVGLRSSLLVATDFGPMVLEADGLAVSSFGDEFENTMAVLELLLGVPLDTGWVEDDPACTGTARHVTWIVQDSPGTGERPAVLVVDFVDRAGTTSFAQYAFRSFDLDPLDPVVQDLTTANGISLGDTLAEFTAAHGAPEFFDTGRGLATSGDGMVIGFEPGDDDSRRIYYIGAGDDGCVDFAE